MNFLMSSEMILLVSYSSMIIKQWYAISFVEVFETIFILLMHVLFFFFWKHNTKKKLETIDNLHL